MFEIDSKLADVSCSFGGGVSPSDHLKKIKGIYKEYKMDFDTGDLNFLGFQESRTMKN